MDNRLVPAVRLRGLTKRYGSLIAVDKLDLEVPPGQVMAFLGPNGAGKSTTTEMILGLAKPNSGTVEVFGHNPFIALNRGMVGAMLQGGALLSDVSVATMLKHLHGLYAHPLRFDQVVELAGIADVLKTKTDKLSGGQAQRVRLAMALLPNPDLLLLDEPTVGLDVEARRRFWATIHSMAGTGRSIVFATHYLDEADEFAQRVVVMAKGKIIADGTGAQIKSTVAGREVSFITTADFNWGKLPAVTRFSQEGDRVTLRSSDSDATLQALFVQGAPAHDIEVSSPSLEDAFVEITQAA